MSNKIAVVTGAAGFIGGALTRALLDRGYCVRAIIHHTPLRLSHPQLECYRIDLRQPSPDLFAVCRDAEAVFHVAAKVEMWGRWEEFVAANVDATNELLHAAQTAAVPKFIFTSSPSVVATEHDLCNVDESVPYPTSYLAYYPWTKALAEQAVLAASGVRGLATIALRPHLIFGPGDRNFVPTILARARARRLFQVGPGTNLVDLTFIEDCVNAHLCALTALDTNPQCRGQAYFISQGEPVNLWQWINDLLRQQHLPPLTKAIPYSTAYAAAYVAEGWSKLVGRPPLLTRFLVSEMTSSHYFNIEAARRELGFTPQYSMAEAFEKSFGVATEHAEDCVSL